MTGKAGSIRAGKTPAFLWLVPFLCLATAGVVNYRITRSPSPGILSAGNGAPAPTLLGEIGRRPDFAFGFRNLLADAAWLEAVQVAGGRRLRKDDYDRLYGLLETVVGLDTRFLVPYLLGGVVLADSPGHVDLAIRFLERGRRAFPDQWLLPFYVGYIRYFALSDPVGGGRALSDAARIAGCPPYISLLATRMLSEGRHPETALALLDAMMREETDPERRRALIDRRAHVEAERDLQILEEAVAAFRVRTGTPPSSLEDLVAAGILRGIPREPGGGRYLLEADGTVRSGRYRERLKVILRK